MSCLPVEKLGQTKSLNCDWWSSGEEARGGGVSVCVMLTDKAMEEEMGGVGANHWWIF